MIGQSAHVKPDALRAFWCRSPSLPNFGDALTPWLIERLTGQRPRFAPPDAPADKFLVTGSIAGLARAACTVWGAGLMWRDEALSSAPRWLAVRGPLTLARVHACGGDCPAVWGDPALLLPRLRPAPAGPRRGVGFVPHFSDRVRLPPGWAAARGWRLIDIQDAVERVIDAIAGCERVLSTSLHGLIVAHAYAVPATWVRLRDLPSGDGTKFHDHYASLGRASPTPVTLPMDVWPDADGIAWAAWTPAALDTDALWRSRPFHGEQPSAPDGGVAR